MLKLFKTLYLKLTIKIYKMKLYKANVTQSCRSYWDMKVTVEAKNKEEAEELIERGEWSTIESSELAPGDEISSAELLGEESYKVLKKILECTDISEIKNYTRNMIERIETLSDITIHKIEEN